MENGIVIPSTIGVPSTYCMRSVFANSMYFAHVNFMDNRTVSCAPVNNKNSDSPMAKELLRKTVEIINAIVTNIIVSMELKP